MHPTPTRTELRLQALTGLITFGLTKLRTIIANPVPSEALRLFAVLKQIVFLHYRIALNRFRPTQTRATATTTRPNHPAPTPHLHLPQIRFHYRPCENEQEDDAAFEKLLARIRRILGAPTPLTIAPPPAPATTPAPPPTPQPPLPRAQRRAKAAIERKWHRLQRRLFATHGPPKPA